MQIIERKIEEMLWDFEGSGEPRFQVPSGDWPRSITVDPTPAYGHDVEVVRVEAQRAALAFPVEKEVTIVLLPREFKSRTNGCTYIGHIEGATEKNDERPWVATIVLCAKRIPIHPAMTRYLVAHEYGHVVRQAIAARRGQKESSFELYEEYQKVRGFKTATSYGCGTWHSSVQELFANDFRILVVGSEKEFWPHPGFARPEGLPEIVEWWKKECEPRLAESSGTAT
jgi:hypothetical protein